MTRKKLTPIGPVESAELVQPAGPAQSVGSTPAELVLPVKPISSAFTLIISKLDTPQDIYNLMNCNSAMKNVFFGDIGDAYLHLIIQFAFPQAKPFQKSLTNSEYYAFLNQPYELPCIDWSHNIEDVHDGEAYNFQKTSSTKISYQLTSFDRFNPDEDFGSSKITKIPKILSFLLLNEIYTDPQDVTITVNHLRWLVEDWGFNYNPIIKKQILLSFDLAKITYCFSSPAAPEPVPAPVGVKEYISPELLCQLYKGPGDFPNATGPYVHRMSVDEKKAFIRYFYQNLNGQLPADIFSNGDYVNFSYDALHELDSTLFTKANLLDAFINRKPEARNIVPIIRWMIKNKMKISKDITSYIFDISVSSLLVADYYAPLFSGSIEYGHTIPWYYLSKNENINKNPLIDGAEEYHEAFKMLVSAGYLPNNHSCAKILAYGDEEIWNLLYARDKYYFYSLKGIPDRNRGKIEAWRRDHDM